MAPQAGRRAPMAAASGTAVADSLKSSLWSDSSG